MYYLGDVVVICIYVNANWYLRGDFHLLYAWISDF